MDQPRQRPTTDEIVSNLCIQLLQLRGCCRPCSPRCQLQISPSTAPSPVKTEDHDSAKYRILGQLQTATLCHLVASNPQRSPTPRRPPTFFGSVHPHPRGNPKWLFSHVLWLARLIGFNFGGHSKGPRRFGPSRQWPEASTGNLETHSCHEHTTMAPNTRHPDCNHNIILCVGSPATAEPSRPDPRE